MRSIEVGGGSPALKRSKNVALQCLCLLRKHAPSVSASPRQLPRFHRWSGILAQTGNDGSTGLRWSLVPREQIVAELCEVGAHGFGGVLRELLGLDGHRDWLVAGE